MRKVALGAMLLFCVLASAQDISKFEAFAGYQLFRVSPTSKANVTRVPFDNFNANGAQGSLQYNFNSFLGIVGEFGVTHTGSVNLGTSTVSVNQAQWLYLFGPRMFVHVTNRISPFMELVVGGVHNRRTFDVPNSLIAPGTVAPTGVTATIGSNSSSFRTTQNAFAAGVGTGLNIVISRLMAIRPIQIDYIATHLPPVSVPGVPPGIDDSIWQSNWKFSAGVSFLFGGRREIPESPYRH
jgi:opacity protein-like surface antigen